MYSPWKRKHSWTLSNAVSDPRADRLSWDKNLIMHPITSSSVVSCAPFEISSILCSGYFTEKAIPCRGSQFYTPTESNSIECAVLSIFQNVFRRAVHSWDFLNELVDGSQSWPNTANNNAAVRAVPIAPVIVRHAFLWTLANLSSAVWTVVL